MLSEIFKKPKTEPHTVTKAASESFILGKVQLLSLPGSSGWEGQWEALTMRAEQEATALASAGVNGLLIENTHDAPYTAERMDVSGAIAFAMLLNRLQQFTGLPVGISILRNDPETALAVAMNTQASFIRFSLLTGSLMTHDGVINSRFHQLLQAQQRLKAKLPPLLIDLNSNQIGAGLLQGAKTRLEHLIALAKALPTQIISPTLVVSDNDLSPDEVVQFRDAVCREVLVENQVHPQQANAYFQSANGIILEAGLRKSSAVQPELPPAVDMLRVEELINQLRNVLPLHEMDPDLFLQR